MKAFLRRRGPTIAVAALMFAAGGATATTAANLVTSADIKDGTIQSVDIAGGGVTSADLANNSVTTKKIANGQVRGKDLADNSVTTKKIANGEVRGKDLADNEVTRPRSPTAGWRTPTSPTTR
jgi:hypothetical protein